MEQLNVLLELPFLETRQLVCPETELHEDHMSALWT